MATAELKTRKPERSVSKFGLPTVEIGCVSLLSLRRWTRPTSEPATAEPFWSRTPASPDPSLSRLRRRDAAFAAGRLLLGVGLVRVRETGVTR